MTCSSTASVPAHIPFGVGVVVVLALFAVLPAQADVRIVSSPGGAVDAYLAAFARVRQSGERVIIDGPVPIRLHAGVEHDPPQSYLRHAAGRCSASTPRDGSTLAPVIRRARRRPPVPSLPPIHQGYVPGSKSGAG